MKNVSDFCHHQEYPKVNGIVFAEGVIQLIDISVNWGPPIKYEFNIGETTSIEVLENRSELLWNDGAVLARSASENGELVVLSGEGDYGSDGFVALICEKTKKLIWLAAFDCSNPFSSIRFDGDVICARTTLGSCWRFPIVKPQEFTVHVA